VNTSSFSTDILRGGPKMILPGGINERIGFTTDNRKKLMINFYISSSSVLKRVQIIPVRVLILPLNIKLSGNYN